MSSAAKAAFDINIERASYFLDMHETLQGGLRGAPRLAYRELPRGAIVFAVGALDAFMCEVSAEVIVARLQHANAPRELREVLRRVQQDLPTLALEVSILTAATDRRARLIEAISDHFQNSSSSFGSKGAAATAERCGKRGSDLWSALGGVGYTDSAARLDHWTDLRHQIVHQGRRPRVRRDDGRRFIELAKAIADRLTDYAGQI